jgi:hypothetical protein
MANEKHGTLTAKLCDEVTKVTNPVKIQDLTFRDGHRCLPLAGGLRTLPIAEEMDRWLIPRESGSHLRYHAPFLGRTGSASAP